MNASSQAAAPLCLVLALAAAPGQGAPSAATSHPKALSPEELKRVYLTCELASSRGLLAMSDVVQCSIVYEELKRRVFDGDYDKLLAWWRLQRSDVAPEKATGTTPGAEE